MSITYKTGDLFLSSAQMLVNPVNTKGVMGRGLAQVFKDKYPRVFGPYKRDCANGALAIGKPRIYGTGNFSGVGYVVCFPTKDDWRKASELSYIVDGLAKLVPMLRDEKYKLVTKVAFPALGCGLGGLDFVSQVQPIMHMALQGLEKDIEIYISKEDMAALKKKYGK